MVSEVIKASAPGKIMLLGEHAVLHGRRCLVAAVNRRIYLTVKKRPDRQLTIRSQLGEFHAEIDDLEIREPFQFVLTVVARYRNRLETGIDIEINSDFSERIGFGSSAAVTVAATAAMHVLLNESLLPENLFSESCSIVREVQGTGSGADVAASVYGGVLAYRQDPLDILELPASFPITLVYSGEKTPTVSVIAAVEANRARDPEIYSDLYDVIDHSVESAVGAIRERNLPAFGRLMNINQGIMDALGVNTQKLASIVCALRQDPGILGAKISGSGLGDCVVGLGTLKNERFPHELVPAEIDPEGVRIG